MANRIIPWNSKNVKANGNELLLLIGNLWSAIVYLQANLLKVNENININNSTSHNLLVKFEKEVWMVIPYQ